MKHFDNYIYSLLTLDRKSLIKEVKEQIVLSICLLAVSLLLLITRKVNILFVILFVAGISLFFLLMYFVDRSRLDTEQIHEQGDIKEKEKAGELEEKEIIELPKTYEDLSLDTSSSFSFNDRVEETFKSGAIGDMASTLLNRRNDKITDLKGRI